MLWRRDLSRDTVWKATRESPEGHGAETGMSRIFLHRPQRPNRLVRLLLCTPFWIQESLEACQRSAGKAAPFFHIFSGACLGRCGRRSTWMKWTLRGSNRLGEAQRCGRKRVAGQGGGLGSDQAQTQSETWRSWIMKMMILTQRKGLQKIGRAHV